MAFKFACIDKRTFLVWVGMPDRHPSVGFEHSILASAGAFQVGIDALQFSPVRPFPIDRWTARPRSAGLKVPCASLTTVALGLNKRGVQAGQQRAISRHIDETVGPANEHLCGLSRKSV